MLSAERIRKKSTKGNIILVNRKEKKGEKTEDGVKIKIK